jgi:hypothetical protein
MVVRAPASTRCPEQTEERLLVEAAQKDPTRLAELYEINFERVYGFVAQRVGTSRRTSRTWLPRVRRTWMRLVFDDHPLLVKNRCQKTSPR